MEIPLFKLTQIGLFDSGIKYPNIKFTPERVTTEYEVEFFAENLSGSSFLNDTIIPIEKNRIIVAKPGQRRHSLFPVKCFNFHLIPKNKTAKQALESLPDIIEIQDMSKYIDIFNSILIADDENNESSDQIKNPLFIELKILELLLLLINDLEKTNHAKTVYYGGVFKKIKQYLDEHFDDDIKLATLAKMANMSPTYFHKIFKSHFGKTPNQYLLDNRIKKAKLLLLNDNYSLTEISFICGFSSQSYFCQAFKKATSLSPLEYRKNNLSKLEF